MQAALNHSANGENDIVLLRISPSRRTIEAAVEAAFNHPMGWQPTEAYEIADAHHAALRQWGKE